MNRSYIPRRQFSKNIHYLPERSRGTQTTLGVIEFLRDFYRKIEEITPGDRIRYEIYSLRRTAKYRKHHVQRTDAMLARLSN